MPPSPVSDPTHPLCAFPSTRAHLKAGWPSCLPQPCPLPAPCLPQARRTFILGAEPSLLLCLPAPTPAADSLREAPVSSRFWAGGSQKTSLCPLLVLSVSGSRSVLTSPDFQGPSQCWT